VSELLVSALVVKDISRLVDLQPGESPLSVSIYHWTDFPGGSNELEEFVVGYAEDKFLEHDFDVPSWGYDGRGLVPAAPLRHIGTPTIVMAIFAG